jgi:hypothetical protein
MSDFGSYILISKKDGNPINQSDKESLNNAIEKVKKSDEFLDSLGEDFLFNMAELEGDNNHLILNLSEYWHGEGDDEENFEFAQDNDMSFAEEVEKLLEKELGNIFLFEAKFENW